MAGVKAHGKILVIDDHYGVTSDDFYSRTDFERDFGGLPFTFVFSSAWDWNSGRYTVQEALRAIEAHKPDGVLLDIVFDQRRSAGRLGLLILQELTAKYPALPVVMMTVLARDEVWAECARLGAVDYLPKPLDTRLLYQTLDRYVGATPDDWLIGQNRQFLDAINLAAIAAEGGQTALMMTGETGTGKELVSRFVHRHGKRADQPFQVIFLPGVPSEMQAAHLFGYRKGAFTGADRDEPGRFVVADGGIVFLDEIGDIDQDTQTRLLRVADTGEVTRLGDGKVSRVDVQLVTATNADLAHKIKNKEFRYDLWARLNGMPVNLPPLAQRRDDIPLLVRHLLRCEALCRRRPIPKLPDRIESTLQDISWEGNIRGLKSYAQRVFDLAGEKEPGTADFLAALPSPPASPTDTISMPTAVSSPFSNNSLDAAAQLQRLRLDELALLHHALERTRDPLTGAINRAKAAALLKGKPKCSTNEFDRWVRLLWDELTPESRQLAADRFPELAELIPPHEVSAIRG